MKAGGIVALVVIVFFFGYVMFDSSQTQDDVVEQFGADVKRLTTITEKIECYTETHDFTCGEISFQANSQEIIRETHTIEVIQQTPITVINENGTATTINQNVTTTQVVPLVSDADITYLDKQTGDFMVCQRGHQCVIESDVKLYDINEQYVVPPYGYLLTITCEHRDGCNVSNTRSVGAGQVTDGSGGIRYSWTTSTNTDSLGDYEVILNVRSAILDSDGSPINLTKKIPLVLIS